MRGHLTTAGVTGLAMLLPGAVDAAGFEPRVAHLDSGGEGLQ